MCGIAGFVHNDSDALADPGVVHAMCEAIVHRGPDDEGVYAKGPVGLGMRRLSIIDLSGGHQPIYNEDKSVWIVFNGEIYNFPELRSQLEGRGHRFYTNTDTEVILHLYEDFGAGCVEDLRGMFAFAIYDERKRRLLLARDRLGIKPLHYAQSDETFFFGSEIKSILTVAPELGELDDHALLEYFTWSYIPDPLTAFKNIHKLPPGHLLEWSDGHVETRRYWDVPAYGTVEPQSEEECIEALERVLAEAVRIRLIADVPLGALLSGGVDSSTIVALMARSSSRPVKTFTIGFSRNDFNEAHYARLVAERFKTEHHELVVEPDIRETLYRLTESLEEPFGDSSMIPTYHVSRLARQHVTVALSGDGGDELFAGYDRYAVNFRRGHLDFLPEWARRQYRKRLHPLLPHSLPGYAYSYNAALPWPERYLDSVSFFPSIERRVPVLSGDFRETVKGGPDPSDRFRAYLNRASEQDPVSRLLYLDTKTYLPGDILTKVDRMSMACSLEARVPLLDHLFVEHATRLPARLKFREDQQKYILKRLAERAGVPKEAINRPKQGFALPLVHWMRNELKEELPAILLDPKTLQRGYFSARGIRILLNEHQRGRRNHSSLLWMLLVFELWHRNFLEARRPVISPAQVSMGLGR